MLKFQMTAAAAASYQILNWILVWVNEDLENKVWSVTDFWVLLIGLERINYWIIIPQGQKWALVFENNILDLQ